MYILRAICLAFLLTLTCISNIYGQEKYNIKGWVWDENKQGLPFAGIYISNLETGLSANKDGYFEISLSPGTYELVFSFLGYAQKRMLLQVENASSSIEVQLQPQSIVLPNANVGNKREDPAYTIMRKSMAKAKFHTLNYQSYSATVYLKGTSEINKIPLLLRRQLEEEGIVEGKPYTLESISKLEFEQPNKMKETVVSIREKGKGNQTIPNSFVQADFYKPLLAGCVSPLSPAAFYYYNFTYDGGFTENNLWINKIKVQPKTKGEQLFEGTLYLVENLWAIHSLDLQTSIQGIQVRVKQLYRPFQTTIWLPTQQAAYFSGKIFGVKFIYHYTTIVNYSKVEPATQLEYIPQLIDPKIDKIPPQLTEKRKNKSKDLQLSDSTVEKTKDFANWVEKYQKERFLDSVGDLLSGSYEWKIDSLAYSYNESFWDSVRPFALSEEEKLSYQREDSFFASRNPDTTSIKGQKFSWGALVKGRTIKTSTYSSLQIQYRKGAIGFNHVEGAFLALPLQFNLTSAKNENFRWQTTSFIRYGFVSQKAYGKIESEIRTGDPLKRHTTRLIIEQFIHQVNPSEPIGSITNSLYSLLAKTNYAKWIEQKNIEVIHSYVYKGKITLNIRASMKERNPLNNHTEFSIFNKKAALPANEPPFTFSAASGTFKTHQLYSFHVQLEKRWGVTYRYYNGKKYAQFNRKPSAGIEYIIGQYSGLQAHSGFSKISIYFTANPLILGKKDLRFKVITGAVVGGNPIGLDLIHFNGNQTLITSMKQAYNFRMLPYYDYSTASSYIQFTGKYNIQKLLVNRIPVIRYSGLKESLVFNYLKIFDRRFPSYYEMGYSIDNIAKIMKLEIFCNYNNAEGFGALPLIGLASFFRL